MWNILLLWTGTLGKAVRQHRTRHTDPGDRDLEDQRSRQEPMEEESRGCQGLQRAVVAEKNEEQEEEEEEEKKKKKNKEKNKNKSGWIVYAVAKDVANHLSPLPFP